MPKITVTLILLVCIVVLSSISKYSQTGTCSDGGNNKVLKSAGPPPYSAGEPPANETCANAGCHDGVTSALNSGTATVNLNLGGAETGYLPGMNYTIKISISKTGMQRSGFQIIALRNNDNSKSPGEVVLIDTNRTQRRDNTSVTWGCCWQNRVWVTHKYNGIASVSPGYNEWTYKWYAPNTNVGNISFYLAALDANNDMIDTMDYTYTKQVTISCSAPVPVFNYIANGLNVAFYDSSQATSFLWNFGDGTTSSLQNPTHIYMNAGTYLVCLKATNACGTDSSCKTIVVSPVSTASKSVLEENNIRIYPNPSSDGKIFVDLKKNNVDELAICNVEGKLVLAVKPQLSSDNKFFDNNTNIVSADLSGEKDGIYFITVRKGGQLLLREKLMFGKTD